MDDQKELKPLFSSMMQRLDPMLKAEDTNCLFEAFRRKREIYSTRSILPKLSRTITALFFGIAILVLAALTIKFGPSAIIVTLFLMIAVAIIGFFGALLFGVTRQNSGLIPSQCTGLFGERATASKQLIFDLYLAGITGRDIVEAMYLEIRRGAYRSLLAGVFLTIGFQLVVYAIALAVDFKNASISITLIFMALTAWQAYEIFHAAGRGLRMQALAVPRTRAQRQKLFLNFEPLVDRVVKDFIRLLIGVPILVVCFIIGITLFGGAAVLLRNIYQYAGQHQETSPLFDYFFVHAPVLVYFLVMIILLTSLRMMKNYLNAWTDRKFKRDFEDTADLFDLILRVHACGDDEMKAYALSVYQQRQVARKSERAALPIVP